MGGNFVTFVASQAGVIFHAWLIFLSAAIVLGIVIYLGVHRLFEGEVSALKARLQLRDDQIAQFRNKVGTASPDEVKARIDTLEAKVAALGPRKLTDKQRNNLTAALAKGRGTIEIAQDMACADARPFTQGFISAFQSAGWNVIAPMIMGPGYAPPQGLALTVADPGNLTPLQKMIADALTEQDIGFDLQRGREFQSHNPIEPRPDAYILVTAKLV